MGKWVCRLGMCGSRDRLAPRRRTAKANGLLRFVKGVALYWWLRSWGAALIWRSLLRLRRGDLVGLLAGYLAAGPAVKIGAKLLRAARG